MSNFIIYLDILGFKQLPKNISSCSGFEEEFIREKCLSNPIKEKIGRLGDEIKVINAPSEISGSDNYILICDNLVETFEIINDFSKIKIPHENFGYIPLEIAIDFKNNINTDVNPINANEIIDVLSNNILTPYKKYYLLSNGFKIKNTFIVMTKEFVANLDFNDKISCNSINFDNKDFFSISPDLIHKKAQLYKFLSLLGIEKDDKSFGVIDWAYVEPNNYEKIKNMLEKKRVIFLYGTPEYGKTYTSIHLMFDFYKKGYNPKWIKGLEKEDRIEVRRKLQNIESHLNEKEIIYFEDPFGRTEYEGYNTALEEFNEIKSFVSSVDDCYVIVTSREEVYKSFKERSLQDLDNIEISLSISTPEYDNDKREEILINWANFYECIWLNDEEIKNSVLDKINDETKLPTPFRLKTFASKTITYDNIENILEQINQISENLHKVFANEIKVMSRSKIVFIAYPLISNEFDLDFVKDEYYIILNDLNENEFDDFNTIQDWFSKDKIDIIDNKIIFSNPAYLESIDYLITENKINKIFSKIILRILNNNIFTNDIIKFLVKFYNYFQEEITQFISKLSTNNEYAKNVLTNLILYKDNFEFDFIEKTLIDIMHTIPKEFLSEIRNNLSILDNGLINRLLIESLSFKESHQELVLISMNNFEVLFPETFEKIVYKVPNEGSVFDILNVVFKNFNKINNIKEILIQLLEYDGIFERIFSMLKEKLKIESKRYIRNFFLVLYDIDNTKDEILDFFSNHFNEINDSNRNFLIFSFSKYDIWEDKILNIIKRNSNKIPKEMLNYLLIKNHFTKTQIRDLLFFKSFFYNILSDETKINLEKSLNELMFLMSINNDFKLDLLNLIQQINLKNEYSSDLLKILSKDKNKNTSEYSNILLEDYHFFKIESILEYNEHQYHNDLSYYDIFDFDDFNEIEYI